MQVKQRTLIIFLRYTIMFITVGIVCLLALFLFGPVIISSDAYESYQRQPKIDGLKFDEFRQATVVKIASYPDNTEIKRTVEKSDKVDFAKRFIQKYPDGWVGYVKDLSANPMPIPDILLYFYDSKQHSLGSYGISAYHGLIKGSYWRYVTRDELRPLLETFDIQRQEKEGKVLRYYLKE